MIAWLIQRIKTRDVLRVELMISLHINISGPVNDIMDFH